MSARKTASDGKKMKVLFQGAFWSFEGGFLGSESGWLFNFAFVKKFNTLFYRYKIPWAKNFLKPSNMGINS